MNPIPTPLTKSIAHMTPDQTRACLAAIQLYGGNAFFEDLCVRWDRMAAAISESLRRREHPSLDRRVSNALSEIMYQFADGARERNAFTRIHDGLYWHWSFSTLLINWTPHHELPFGIAEKIVADYLASNAVRDGSAP